MTAKTLMVASTTRLQLRSARFLLPFSLAVLKIRRQALRAPGNLGIKLRKSQGLAFWTKTLWASEAALIDFHTNNPHQNNKPHIHNWCDEAAHAHWPSAETSLPNWHEAEQALIKYGSLPRLDYPSADHRAGTIVIR